jgi:hypothetical protein
VNGRSFPSSGFEQAEPEKVQAVPRTMPRDVIQSASPQRSKRPSPEEVEFVPQSKKLMSDADVRPGVALDPPPVPEQPSGDALNDSDLQLLRKSEDAFRVASQDAVVGLCF